MLCISATAAEVAEASSGDDRAGRGTRVVGAGAVVVSSACIGPWRVGPVKAGGTMGSSSASVDARGVDVRGPQPGGGFTRESGDAGDVAAPTGIDGRPQGGQSWVEDPYALAVGGEAQA